jgi:hypothetical protein
MPGDGLGVDEKPSRDKCLVELAQNVHDVLRRDASE